MKPTRPIAIVAGALALANAAPSQTPTPFGAVVEVSRVLTEVRVVDLDGNPVLGLTPDDFRVILDGRPAEVEAVTWITSDRKVEEMRPDATPGTKGAEPAEPIQEGRTIVVLVQSDFGLEPSRTVGLMRMAPRAADFVRALDPGDRVALLTYGSHLRLLSDFTTEHQALAESVTTMDILEGAADPPPTVPPLLADHLDSREAKMAAQMVDGLELIGRALGEIPGAKSLVYFGFALGRDSTGPGIGVGRRYERAMEVLSASRTSVFSLDLTDADYHTLGLGLMILSEDTGGFYLKTHQLPDLAMDRLTRVISSYYELSIVPPPDLDDEFKIKVKVDRRGVRVHTRQWHPSNYEW
jgi:VWFA-related protein